MAPIFARIACRRRTVAASLLLALAVAIAGCGGGSGGDDGYEVKASTTMTVASPPIAPPQFLRQMNRTCREAWNKVTENFSVYSSTQDSEVARRRRMAETIQLSLLAGLDFHIFDNFRIMGSPAGQEEAIEEIIGPFQKSVELGQIRLRLFSIADVANHFREYNGLAAAYGLDDCLVDLPHLRRLRLVTTS